MLIQMSNESCEITDSFDYFSTGSFEFSSLVLLGVHVRGHLERESVLLFKLLFEMKFILTCQT